MAHPLDLTGKVALVTGGNGGIGLGMAEAMGQAGAAIAIWGTNPDKNAKALERLHGQGITAEAWVCNVADKADVQAKTAQTIKALGRIDGCFANAGVSGRATGHTPFHEMPDEEWHRVLSVNLEGVRHTYQAVLAHMVERAEKGDAFGRLVGISSLASVSGTPRNEHYAATKGALNAMTFSLAVEYARFGITANAILPGWIETEMTAKTFANPKFAEIVGKRVPVRRWGQAADFGGMAVYLMSDASAYHTGQLMQIDGGYWRF